MAEPLKDFFSPALAQSIADELHLVDDSFARERFVALATHQLEPLALLDRGRRFAAGLAAVLPPEFDRAADLIEASLPPVEAPRDGVGMAPFRYLPHTIWATEQGMASPERTLDLLHALTQRFTAEWAIRELLIAHPELTWSRLESWVEDPSAHVRRLVSEGTRTRLPWAKKVPELFAQPERTLALLERLRDDPSEYVRRSVANNLNDLAKDFTDLVVATCTRWHHDAPEPRRKLVVHALRTLVKRGDLRALALMGAGEEPEVELDVVRFEPGSPRIGDRVRIEVELVSQSDRAQRLLVDLAVHFVKARGVGRKVFKVAVVELAAGERRTVGLGVSLAQHTTRTHYPGRHQVELLINGRSFELGAFELLA